MRAGAKSVLNEQAGRATPRATSTPFMTMLDRSMNLTSLAKYPLVSSRRTSTIRLDASTKTAEEVTYEITNAADYEIEANGIDSPSLGGKPAVVPSALEKFNMR